METIKKKVIAIICLAILSIIGIVFLITQQNKNKEEVIEVVPTPTVEPVSTPEVTYTPEPEPSPTVAPIDINSENSINKIVNKDNMISENYVPELITLNVSSNGEQQLRPEAASALEEMFKAAGDQGINLYVVSAYRSYKTQKSLWYTYEEKYGRKYADKIDATAGASEHQLGLAVDLSGGSKCKLKQCFANTDAGKWLAENSYKFGYILRYPDGKESITKIIFSPWHFRYIGKEEALKVFESKLTLEEYYLQNNK